ncbi:Hint domain-containing protein [Gymnodinialimonas sp. 2305UL16-5]|uniref:Hint domain-containing protein n=1 Tax=Gymnodinialimonas mytili TaxID=3126503 RepID=UPI0030AE3CA0
MPFTIYMLPEALMSVTGVTASGDGLDGVTQGDGSHLDNATITLNSNAWQAIEINDNDTDFADNDSGQQLVNSETVETEPGVFETFPPGTVVEAEFGITVTDPDGNSYQLVAFNFRTGSPGYATVEGLAFIGPQGGFPPVGQPLTVTGSQEGPSFAAPTYATPICFVAGTRIATPNGEVAIEDLCAGDLVITCEGGAEPIRWIGSSRFPAEGRLAPVEFARGALGNARPLWVSRQHRIRLSGWRAELYFGEDAVWVPAAHFLGRAGVSVVEGGEVTYYHLLLDAHRTLLAEGVEAESLHPGEIARETIGAAAEAELMARFPDLGPLSRRCISHLSLTAREARILVAA